MELTINNKKIKVNKPATILEIAKKNNIHIPSLCAHPELTPHGGCRLCIVEIEGQKGYPSACTTIINDDMVVRTDTNILKKMRKELVQLILSEHPAGCLLCTDEEGCSNFQGTIRKVGVTTGCRWCPKDQDCEFQKLVKEFEIQELELPGLYRGLPVEKYDPFFDRDYNLCIYCDRCVRICNEFRLSSILSLKQRGKQTTIGPAFEDSHIDAGCEFCGACVSVCPTGAMSEKSRKWWGLPDEYSDSVCPVCSLNCDIQVLSLKNKIVGTIPLGVPHEAGGELCVKGRFCLSELVNRTKRILEPEYKYEEDYGIVSWDIAIKKTAELMQDIKANRSAVLLSPNLSLEELKQAKFIAEKVLKTDDISSSIADKNLFAFMRLASSSSKLKDIEKAGSILSFFLNGNYNFAPVTLRIKEAANNGIPYYQIGWVKDTTTRFSKEHFTPKPGTIHDLLDNIINGLKIKNQNQITELTNDLMKKNPVIIIGPEIMSLTNCISVIDKIIRVVQITNAKLYIPNPHGNLTGMISMIKLKPFFEIEEKLKEGKYDLLYLIGDNPFYKRPNAVKIIYQNAFPGKAESEPDIILPTAVWGETSGSYMNTDKKIKKIKALADPHGYSISHENVFKMIAKELKIKLPKFKVKEFEKNTKTSQPNQKPSKEDIILKTTDKKHPYVLIQEKAQHTYSNLNLSKGVEGFGELVKPEHLMLHPKDAKKLNINNNDEAELVFGKNKRTYPVIIRKQITPGFFYLPHLNGEIVFENNPCPVNIIKKHKV